MIESKEFQQRAFIGDVLDDEENLQEIKMVIDEVVWDDGHSATEDESFELNGEYVTYNELIDRFGTSKIDAFVADATQNAR